MKYQIITFYEFKDLTEIGGLEEIKESLKRSMRENSVFGTVILAAEGFNSTVGGEAPNVETFVKAAENILQTKLKCKRSFHASIPFRRVHVKIKPEIVTLKRQVEIAKGVGTHVPAQKWNEIISDAETIVLDARNDYEYQVGTFQRAINPRTRKFSELPEFVEKNIDPRQHKKIAMFCTGGIRCEKFAPLVKDLGFAEVYQLEGGILQYLEEIPAAESLWQGECFVFDDRVSVDENLQKGNAPDLSTGK
jgi:UPF0176 protein